MAKWLRTLDLTPEYVQATEGEIDPGAMAKIVSDRLQALPPLSDKSLNAERERLAEEFDALVQHGGDTGDFDAAMEALYDWADTPLSTGTNCCWIKTF